MKKRNIYRALAAGLATVMMLSAAGCGGSSESGSDSQGGDPADEKEADAGEGTDAESSELTFWRGAGYYLYVQRNDWKLH